jgi:adenylate kinase
MKASNYSRICTNFSRISPIVIRDISAKFVYKLASMNIIILGPQGSGKGTQAQLIAKKYGLVHIEMGKLLREIASEETNLGRKVNRIINKKKELVSDKLIDKILTEKINKISKNKGIIFDGIPRKLSQVKLLDKILEKFSRKIDRVLFVRLPKSESIKRISRRFQCERCEARLILGKDIENARSKCPVCGGKAIQRPDDTPAGVSKRLKIFQKETMPAIDYFKKQGLLAEVNGKQAVGKVFKDIIKVLE